MGNEAIPMSKEQLLGVLRDMAVRVSTDDSFSGSIEYDAMSAPQGVDFMVRGAYRIGNSEGQGGMRVVGSLG